MRIKIHAVNTFNQVEVLELEEIQLFGILARIQRYTYGHLV